jgi:hypothetical protein
VRHKTEFKNKSHFLKSYLKLLTFKKISKEVWWFTPVIPAIPEGKDWENLGLRPAPTKLTRPPSQSTS